MREYPPVTVTTKPIACGITAAARQLNVSYTHLWSVLTGRLSSPSLVMLAKRVCPSLLDSPRCKIPWKEIIEKNAPLYRWDEDSHRYIKRKDKRGETPTCACILEKA